MKQNLDKEANTETLSQGRCGISDAQSEPPEKLSNLRMECLSLCKERDRLASQRNALRQQCTDWTRVRENFAPVAGKNIPVYISDDLRPLASPKTGSIAEKIMLCSIPKSGTYLYSRLLELLGMQPTNLHLWMTHILDLRFSTVDEARNEYSKITVKVALPESLKLVQAGQFAASHLERSWETVELLSEFKVIFVYREMRDVLVSDMRWVASTAWGGDTDAWGHMEEGPEKMLCYFDQIAPTFLDVRCHPLLGWLEEPGVLRVSFEQICGDRGVEAQKDTIRNICEFCGVDFASVNSQEILDSLLGVRTMTWSGERTNWRKNWNEAVEERFVRLGGKDANRRLGYCE